jgi:hypothetical protein
MEKAFQWGDMLQPRASAAALALVDGDVKEVRSLLTLLGGDADANLCVLWAHVCFCVNFPRSDAGVAACIAACIAKAFARAGLPLRRPFQSSISSAVGSVAAPPSVSTIVVGSVDSPFCLAVRLNRVLAMALLDLPPEYGLDVNAKTRDGGTAIGYANGDRLLPFMFERLLCVTDRSVISDGHIYMDRGCEQFISAKVHVLISAIMHCCYQQPPPHVIELAQTFIANAHPDGSGTDLTAGVTHLRSDSRDISTGQFGPFAHEMWPDCQFRGVLPLLEILFSWHHTNTHDRTVTIDILTRLWIVHRDLVLAMRRIRTYLGSIRPHVARPLIAGGIHVIALQSLIVGYILVPLRDATQLDHPLLVPDTDNILPQCASGVSEDHPEKEITMQVRAKLRLGIKSGVDADLVDPGLYVGSLAAARDVQWVRSVGITHILSVLTDWRSTTDALSCSDWRQAPTRSDSRLADGKGGNDGKDGNDGNVKQVEGALPAMNVVRMFVPIADSDRVDIGRHFGRCTRWIRAAIRGGGRVLVHCQQGISRSATIACAYVMITRRLVLPAALAHLRTTRPQVRPNGGFLDQLTNLDQQLARAHNTHIRKRTISAFVAILHNYALARLFTSYI